MTIYKEPIDSNEHGEPREQNNSAAGPASEPSLADELSRKLSKIQGLGRDISAFINGFQLNIDRDHGAVQINLRKKTRPQVELIPLLQYCEEIEPMQAIIGWNKTQEPMTWSAIESNQHLLISGNAQSGKTGLLRSLVLTFVLATRPSQLQFAIIDGSCRSGTGYDHSGLKKFSNLPHLLNRPPTNPDEVCEIINFIATEADHRLKHEISTPKVLLIIDNLQDILPVAGPEFHQQLEHILDIGSETGIQVILATNRPEDGRLQDLISGIEIDRITGKVHSTGQAAFATGRDGSDADHLNGDGEFLATINLTDYHFQAAWINEKQLDHYLNYLSQPKQPALLAWSIPTDETAEDFYDDGSAYRFGFLDSNPKPADAIETVEEVVEDLESDFEENVEPLVDEVELDENLHNQFENWHLAEPEELDEGEDEFTSDELEELEEDRLIQLENIYTKLTGFWQTSPENESTNDESEPAIEGKNFLNSNVFEELEVEEEESWDEFEEDENSLFEYEPAEPVAVIQEPKSDYYLKPNSNGWLDYAADQPDDEAPEGESNNAHTDLPEKSTEDEAVIDDAFTFSAENLANSGRRSRIPKAKPKLKFKPVPKTVSEPKPKAADSENEPFDPWQSGLEDEPEDIEENPELTGFKKPPRLTPQKTTHRRRLRSSLARPKPKPKVKPAHLINEAENENNGEFE